jgi:hypothetical protein
VRGGHGTTSSGYGRYSSEKNGTKEKTLQQKGTKSEENMCRPFMEIFFISVQQFQQGGSYVSKCVSSENEP